LEQLKIATMNFESIVDSALKMMRSGPKSLAQILDFTATNNDVEPGPQLMEQLRDHLASGDPNNAIVGRFGLSLRNWDHEDSPTWASGTPAHSSARRQLICTLLKLSEADSAVVDAAIPPFTRAERATVITDGESMWYDEGRANRGSFYWDAYVRQLSGAWSDTAVNSLANSADDIVSRLADPSRVDRYAAKGLVVGYVQSGKTAHFTGVIAKAIDAGYRLIIVLAGTLNILRRQTQRRLDKELVGREQLPEDEYHDDPGLDEFLRHGSLPSELGGVDIHRLTGLDDDFSRLGAKITAIQFTRADAGLPFNHPVNLKKAPVRLVVVKKIPKILVDLALDLADLGAKGATLRDVPALIIDDESDQASVNTLRPSVLSAQERAERTATNDAIVSLMKVLPRAQYVGYTATPFANVFIDPSDAEQLYPRDFIVSLPRPQGYMGVREFFDFDWSPDEPGPNEQLHVRKVEGDDGTDVNLPRAIDLFVLSGALKLLRQELDPALRFKHHTMLVHHATQTDVHDQQREIVEQVLREAAFTTKKGLMRLAKRYDAELAPGLYPSLPAPSSFDVLRPYIAKCVAMLNDGTPVRIVNGDDRNSEDTPDFDAGPVWAILIGGTKLSRGYTVEGLTVSYYRRKTNAGDTLMQMGRWFGFRRGYQDLVRWFVGTKEPVGKTKKTVNLYLQFRALCRDEEAFRAELEKYADEGNIKPIQVPPLVSSHMPSLRPTAGNKMYNAVLTHKDFGGKWTEKVAVSIAKRAQNLHLAGALLASVDKRNVDLSLVKDGGAPSRIEAIAGRTSHAEVSKFLEGFNWSEDARPFYYEMDFADRAAKAREITSWVVVVPQVKGGTVEWPQAGVERVSVARRAFDDTTGYSVFSEPRHRDVAKALAGLPLAVSGLSSDLEELCAPKTAVMFLYLVRPVGDTTMSDDIGNVSVGFAVQFPPSSMPGVKAWTVHKKAEANAVVVDA
jgi:hypothetical protein